MKKNILIVHGPHRSGTSAVTGLLANNFNLDFGEGIIGAAKDNIKGFYENQAIVDLNEQILNSQGLDWFNAKNLNIQTIQESFFVEAERIIEKEYSSENPVILKDPRNCFLYPFWKKILKSKFNLFHVVVMRNIEASAFSLKYRNAFPLMSAARFTHAQTIQMRNNLLDEEKVYWTLYEKVLSDPDDFLQGISSSFKFLKKSNNEKNNFIEKSLNNFDLKPFTNIGKSYDSIIKVGNETEIKKYFEYLDNLQPSDFLDFESLPSRKDIDKIQNFIVSLMKSETMLIKKQEDDISSLTKLLNKKSEEAQNAQNEAQQAKDEAQQARELVNKLQLEINDLNAFISSRRVGNLLKSYLKAVLKIGYYLTPLPKNLKFKLKYKIKSFLRPTQNLDEGLKPFSSSPLDNLDDLLNYKFNTSPNPKASIIIPVFNQVSFTVQCLKSIAQMKCLVPYEIIIADDNPDSKVDFSNIKGIKYILNSENLGFNLNCNSAAKKARGEYIVFLNNDTFVQDYWLDELISPFETQKNVGVTGSKIINDDGTLQEAGGIIFEDGTGWNWGRNDDPNKSIFSFLREVDYVSGCSLCIKKKTFLDLGGFSSKLDKAYYEDTYLSFKLRESNLRTIYNPFSKIIHFEGISNGKDINAGIKKFQEKNRGVFLNRFKEALSKNKEISNQYLNSDRYIEKHVLIVDEVTPRPDEDSGSNDMYNLIDILLENGFRVHFFPYSNQAIDGDYTFNLQKKGVNCLYHPTFKNIDDIEQSIGNIFSHIVLTRLSIADELFEKVKSLFSNAKIIFNTVDLHSLREKREAQIKKLKIDKSREHREIELCKLSDSTIVISDVEHKLLKKEGVKNLHTVPLIREEADIVNYNPIERNSMIFIGGFRHPPNLDGINWFLEEVWEKIKDDMVKEDIQLHIIGSHMPKKFLEKEYKNVHIKGYVEDLEIAFRDALISIAPLRYGAGLKGKVATSFSYGVPVLGTDIAFEGMPNSEKIISKDFTANSAKEFQNKIRQIFKNKEHLENTSSNCVSYFNETFGRSSVEKKVLKVFK